MKNIMNIVFVLIGTLIGAGFASGQEINVFFFSHGINGILGIVVSTILMGVIIYKTLKIIEKYQVNNYKDFIEILLKNIRNRKIKKIINFIINAFILITFFIMIAGFGAYFEQELGINSIIGSAILATVTFFIIIKSDKGVVKANEILVPILIISLIIIGVINLKEINILELNKYIINTSTSNWLIDAILYSSYNSILLIPVIITLKNYIKDKKQMLMISTIITTVVIMLSILVFIILSRIDVNIENLEMPVAYVVSYMPKIFTVFYGIVILGSIFTTSVSLGNSFLRNICKDRKSYPQIGIIMCITSLAVSKIGFSNLVSILYPIFGFLGILQIYKIFKVSINSKKYKIV